MKKNNIFISSVLLLIATCSLSAQSTDIKVGSSEDEKIKVTIGGRVLFDGAVYLDDKTPFSNGTTISDSRLSLKSSYKQWDMKIDIGFHEKKVNTKDIHIRYNFNEHSWAKIGYYGEQFGLEGWESSAWQKFMAPAASDQAFATGRQLGITYINWNKYLYYSGGIFADYDALSNTKTGNQGYGFISKVSYNPLNDRGDLFHVGISGEFRNGNRNGYGENNRTKRELTYATNLITKVDKQKPVSITVDNVDYQFRYVAELMATTGPTFLQGEYYHVNVKRKHQLDSYQAQGFYIQSGVMLFGDKTYEYDLKERKLARPGDNTLEFVVRYNYTDLNDDHGAGTMKGGRMSDVTLGLNYYFSKYFGTKLNYSFVKLGDHSVIAPDEKLSIIQARFLVSF